MSTTPELVEFSPVHLTNELASYRRSLAACEQIVADQSHALGVAYNKLAHLKRVMPPVAGTPRDRERRAQMFRLIDEAMEVLAGGALVKDAGNNHGG